MTKTMTLTDFLLARIAEDEARISLVSSAPPQWSMTVHPHDGERIPVDVPALTPRRALSDCAAKRAVVLQISNVAWHGSYATRDVILEMLAQPYVDHPDFLSEWRA